MSEPVVLVPGLACTAALYDPQSPVWGGRETIVLDHARDDSLGGIAERFLRDAPARFALAGLSMGGYVCFEILRRAPDCVTRLALLDTSARPDTPEATERRLRLIEIAESGRLRDIHPLLWERLVHPDRYGDADLEQTVLGMMLDTGAETFVRQQRAIIARPDSRPLLPRIAVPTLVAVGEKDVITPPEHAEEMARAIPGAVLLTIPHCGHLSTLEQPEALNAALKTWLG